MTYAFTARVRQPVEVYDASHAEVLKAAGDEGADGLILHMARAVADGFEVLEIWQSREQADRFNQEVVGPALARAGVATDGQQPELEEFEPRVVMVPQAYAEESS